MKIYLSNYWRQTGYLLLVSIVFIILGTIVFCIWSNDREDYIFVLCSAYFILVLTGIFLCSKRFLTYIIIDNKEIKSFSFFSRELCSVSTERKIYYTIFSTPQGVKRAEFIAISNEPFIYQETFGFAKVRFIQHYNTAKQIIIPYNFQILQLLDVDKWERIN